METIGDRLKKLRTEYKFTQKVTPPRRTDKA